MVFPRVVHEKNGDRQPKTLIPRPKHRIVITWQMSVLFTDNQDGRENLPETQQRFLEIVVNFEDAIKAQEAENFFRLSNQPRNFHFPFIRFDALE